MDVVCKFEDWIREVVTGIGVRAEPKCSRDRHRVHMDMGMAKLPRAFCSASRWRR